MRQEKQKMIGHYSFGRIVVNGREYTADIIVFPDGRVMDSWWRENGHRLSINDITELVDSAPEIIIAGTGASGLMKPDPDLRNILSEKGIEFRAAPSEKAVELYNELCGRKKVGACFHLTC